MLLIYPPLAKACEPPAGLAMLAGALRGHGHPCTMLDANLEGQLHLLRNNPPGRDTWSRRAHRHRAANLAALRDPGLYAEPARYHRAVSDLSRTLGGIGRDDLTINPANYQDHNLSPLQSADLLRGADHPAGNLFYDYFAPRLDELLQESPPPLIGFSINYLSQALTAFAMIGYLKRKHPGLPIAAGGGLITSWLSAPAVTDHGIRHPGLANLPAGKRLQGAGDARHRLAMCTDVHEQADNTADSVPCDRLPPNRRDPFNGLIDHLVAGPGEGTLLNILAGQATAEESDNICPDFKGLPLADYLAPGPILPYAASSGCYWRQCSFCPEKAEANPYRARPVAQVIAQLAGLTAATKPSLIHFLDNAISPALMRALIADPPGPAWYSFARAEPELTDPGFCRDLRRSGCVMLKLGLESGDQSVLDAMAKGIDLGMVAKTLANLEMAGIATYVYLLFGTPAESLAEARRTLEFTVAHRSAITFLNLAIFNMPRFAPDAALLAKAAFYEGDLSLYTDFEHPRGWNRREIRRFLDREFKRHPAIAPIVRRDPPFFTSNHAPFFRAGNR